MSISNVALKQIWQDRYQKNGETYDENLRRVANYIGQNDEERNEFYEVMSKGLFFPAGRTMSNSGIGKSLTLNNCFVYPTINDSMDSIFEAVKAGAMTHKAGGGIGYDFSLLRPNGTPTSNDAIASGVVSFMDVFNAQTRTVMQGSRRGANMGVLNIYHPDIEEFIEAKSKDTGRLNHFNLSVMVDDKFMAAMLNDCIVTLHYPVYDEKYHIIEDESKWKITKTVSARSLWDKIIKLAYDNGEPGVLFYDNLNNLNNTWYTETITHTNPCGEYIAGTVYGEGLKSADFAGACNLGSLMLHRFVVNPFKSDSFFDFSELSKTIRVAVRMLDNIIDINNYPLPQYERYQKSMRTIGLGYTGLADCLAMLGMRYNTAEARAFVDELTENIAFCAYNASVDLAKEKGCFELYDADNFVTSGFLEKHYSRNDNMRDEWRHLIDRIQMYGIRNARLLSVAPTGTLSLTYGENCSSGIEPIFSKSYDRWVKIGGQSEEDKQLIHIEDYAYHIWKESHQDTDDESLFTTALEMSVDDHVKMLCTIARNVDMSVSKTINVPTDYSFEDTKNIYLDCWRGGVKGCTIFRPNELRQGVLVTNTEKQQENTQEITEKQLNRGDWKPKAADTVYYQRKLKTGCGKLNLFIGWSDGEQQIQDFYVKKSSEAGCERLTEAVAISMSAILRLGGSLDNIEKALKGSGVCPSFARERAKGKRLSRGSSCGVAIFNEIKDFYNEKKSNCQDDNLPTEKKFNEKPIVKVKKNDEKIEDNGIECPECHKKTLRYEGGCNVCTNCGYSSCG